MKYDYQTMLMTGLEPDEVPPLDDTTAELLHLIVRELPAPVIDQIARRLENERYQFSFTQAPGHLVWYPRKLALCALFQRLRRGKG